MATTKKKTTTRKKAVSKKNNAVKLSESERRLVWLAMCAVVFMLMITAFQYLW